MPSQTLILPLLEPEEAGMGQTKESLRSEARSTCWIHRIPRLSHKPPLPCEKAQQGLVVPASARRQRCRQHGHALPTASPHHASASPRNEAPLLTQCRTGPSHAQPHQARKVDAHQIMNWHDRNHQQVTAHHRVDLP